MELPSGFDPNGFDLDRVGQILRALHAFLALGRFITGQRVRIVRALSWLFGVIEWTLGIILKLFVGVLLILAALAALAALTMIVAAVV